MARYSDIDDIDQAVIALVCSMEADPYPCFQQALPRVKRGTMSVADVIEKIRLRYGDRAARSIRITLH